MNQSIVIHVLVLGEPVKVIWFTQRKEEYQHTMFEQRILKLSNPNIMFACVEFTYHFF